MLPPVKDNLAVGLIGQQKDRLSVSKPWSASSLLPGLRSAAGVRAEHTPGMNITQLRLRNHPVAKVRIQFHIRGMLRMQANPHAGRMRCGNGMHRVEQPACMPLPLPIRKNCFVFRINLPLW
jgi:hypothetical protein